MWQVPALCRYWSTVPQLCTHSPLFPAAPERGVPLCGEFSSGLGLTPTGAAGNVSRGRRDRRRRRCSDLRRTLSLLPNRTGHQRPPGWLVQGSFDMSGRRAASRRRRASSRSLAEEMIYPAPSGGTPSVRRAYWRGLRPSASVTRGFDFFLLPFRPAGPPGRTWERTMSGARSE